MSSAAENEADRNAPRKKQAIDKCVRARYRDNVRKMSPAARNGALAMKNNARNRGGWLAGLMMKEIRRREAIEARPRIGLRRAR